jgi:hypothetical protein
MIPGSDITAETTMTNIVYPKNFCCANVTALIKGKIALRSAFINAYGSPLIDDAGY